MVPFPRERLLRIAWTACLFVALTRLFPTWEFVTDDGSAVNFAARAFTDPFWWGAPTSVRLKHLPFVYYLWSPFLYFGSLRTLQLAITALHCWSHWLLIGIGIRLRGPALGYLASALAFLSPAFYVFYNQKFWEPAPLPFLGLAAFLAFHAWLARGRKSSLLAGLLVTLVSVGAHWNALAWLPAFALAVGERARGRPLPRPFLLAVAAAAAGLAAWNAGSPRGSNIVSSFAEIVSPFRPELAAHVGFAYPGQPWWALPECALFLLFFARRLFARAPLRGVSRSVTLWLLLAILPLMVEATYLGRYRAHWLLVLFPLAWLACADSFLWLGDLAPPRWRAGLAAACAALWLFTQGRRSLELEGWVRRSGGRGPHLSSLATKDEVLDHIFRQGQNPRVFLAVNPYQNDHWYAELEAWNFLLRRRRAEQPRQSPGGPETFFYLYAEGSPGADLALYQEWKAATGGAGEDIGPVSVLRSPRLIEAGVTEVH